MSITTSYVDGQVLKAENVTEIVTKINANETSINGLGTNKVDKVTGKSLISDTTIADLTDTTDTSLHYHSIDRNRSNHVGTQLASTITQDTNNRFVSDTEKSTWNGKIDNSKIGVVNGVAQLDNNGLVPSNQLPSYVDDVLEYTSNANFPTTGESGKIYLNTTTNLTYRWSGTVYVVISPSLALGETSTTAYSGDKGKATTDNVNSHIADGVKHIISAERTTWNGKATQTDIDTSVNSIQIGGRNYFYNSNISTDIVSPATGYNQYDFNHSLPEAHVITGVVKYYTVSFVYTPNLSKVMPFTSIIIGNGTDGASWGTRHWYLGSNVKQYNTAKYSYTFTFTVNGATSANIYNYLKFVCENNNSGCTIELIKIERGTKATDFILSQEDMQTKITNGATRPTATYIGQSHFDTTLNKPIWWNGTGWKDAMGTTV